MNNDEAKIGTIGKSPLRIGRFTYGFQNLIVNFSNEDSALNIGNFCSIAKNVTIFLGGNHRTDWITTYPFGSIHQQELISKPIIGHPSTNGDINIGHDVWIGSDVAILSGVTIGSGAVIGTRSLVTKDVHPYEIVGGNPAKHIRFRFEPEIIDGLLSLKWWDFEIEIIKEIALLLCQTPNKDILEKIKNYKNSKPNSSVRGDFESLFL